MLKTLGIVEACYRTPAARSRAARKLGGKPVLEWIVRRATDCQQLGGVIVVTSNAPENQFISRLVPLDVPVFVGKRSDPLRCLAAALAAYPAEGAVRIGASCPFIDPMLVDRLVITADAHPECDYVGYCSRDGRPAILSPVGMFAEWFRPAALVEAARLATSEADRELVTRYLYSHPEKYRIRLIPAPPQIDREDVRLTVDIEEDWEHALAIFEALGPDELDWRRIANLLDHQPALRSRMALLNRVYART
ncbi:MAG: NTP transferase domain-containing protein [Thermoguttaceae bacterium]